MKHKIEDLVAGIMAVIVTKGYPQNTLDTYRYSYNSITRWFNENNGGVYDLDAATKYLSQRQELVRQNKIQPSFYQHSKRFLNFLGEYAETGVARLSYEYGQKLYNASSESVGLIESVLDSYPLPEKSKPTYRTLFCKFFCFIEGENLSICDVTIEIMLSFINYSHDGRSSNANVYRTLRMLGILAKYLTAAGLMNHMPDFSSFAPKSRRKRIISAFSMEEVSKILATFDKTTAIGKRNYAIVLLACGTGLRGSDISKLKPRDIDWKSGEISITQEKTGKPVTIVAIGQIRNAIADYIISGRPASESDTIFLSVRAPHTPLKSAGFSGIIDRACTIANIPKKSKRSFHSLRRSFGTWMAKEAVSVHTIAQMLGQASPDASVPYLSFDDKQILSCAMGFSDIPLKGGVYQ